jgi:adenosylcobyric acid synthase
MTRLLLIAHAATAWNDEGRYQGWSDVPLSDVGREQAARLAERLRDLPLDAIVSSDLTRAVETATAFAKGRTLTVRVDRRLREMNFGSWEGKTAAEIGDVGGSWHSGDVDARPPEGESLAELATRVDDFLAEPPTGVVAVVAHRGSLRVLICRALGLAATEHWSFRLDIASISELDLSSGRAVLTRLNDTSDGPYSPGLARVRRVAERVSNHRSTKLTEVRPDPHLHTTDPGKPGAICGGRTLMVQGASSSVGKSLFVAALCRIFVRRGLRVAPFKAQNMSNNAAVCADGSEIGRSTAVQAAACRLAPAVDMNPVLLKPEADARAQVVVMGKPWKTLAAGSYFERQRTLWPIVTAALDRLRAAHDLVVIEGAGSPAELNLTRFDIVNMAIARHARSPVLLVGDIDRGGVFAQLLGTLDLLAAEDRALVRGLVINKFRGDPALFAGGADILRERGGVPVLGMIPYLSNVAIPEEDAAELAGSPSAPAGRLEIAVIRLPRIANFDDFDPLRSEPGVAVRFVESAETLGRTDAVIVPGTKSTMADLAWLRERRLDVAIAKLAIDGAAVVGICGGFQMLGRRIRDPEGAESPIRESPGLGLLPSETVFAAEKTTRPAAVRIVGGPGWLNQLAESRLGGYEIHMGRTSGGREWLDGVGSDADATGRVWGCYLHGLFADDAFRRAWLASLRPEIASSPATPLDAALDRWADVVEASLDMGKLTEILAGSPT